MNPQNETEFQKLARVLKLVGVNLYEEWDIPNKDEIEKEVKEWFKIKVKWGNKYVRQTTKTIE